MTDKSHDHMLLLIEGKLHVTHQNIKTVLGIGNLNHLWREDDTWQVCFDSKILMFNDLNHTCTYLYRIIFVENWRSWACKMVNPINLNQQCFSDIYNKEKRAFNMMISMKDMPSQRILTNKLKLWEIKLTYKPKCMYHDE